MRPALRRVAFALGIGLGIAGFVVSGDAVTAGPAAAYSCAGPDRTSPADYIEAAPALFTGTVVAIADDGSPPVLVTFVDIVVWKGEGVDAAEIDMPVSPLFTGDLEAGDRVHVFLDARGWGSGCALYNATGGATEMIPAVWPELDALLADLTPVSGTVTESPGEEPPPEAPADAGVPGGWIAGVIAAFVLGGVLGVGVTVGVRRSSRRRSS